MSIKSAWSVHAGRTHTLAIAHFNSIASICIGATYTASSDSMQFLEIESIVGGGFCDGDDSMRSDAVDFDCVEI